MARQKHYTADLSDEEWAILGPFLAPRRGGKGRPASIERREVANAIFYVLRTGCQWRDLPEGFPHWNTVYGYFAKWRGDGAGGGQRRAAAAGARAGGAASRAERGHRGQPIGQDDGKGGERGYDAGKQVKGRK